MRKLRLLAFSCALLSCAIGCSAPSAEDKSKDDKDASSAFSAEIMALEAEVEKIHDEPMAKMADISRFRRLAKAELETATPERQETLRALIRQLDGADDAMMEWMRNYDRPSDAMKGANQDSVKNYLETQKRSAEAMSRTFFAALDSAQAQIQTEEPDNQ